MTDDLTSWDLLMDYALGQARMVLDHATAEVMRGHVDEDMVAAAVTLSSEWRSLADAWGERMDREGFLTDPDDVDDEVEDEVDDCEYADVPAT